MSEKMAPDWERIEAEYRAGLLSLREIAANHPGVNHVAITRRADKEGWVRDLAAKIKAKADELVTRQAVTEGVTAGGTVSERSIVDGNAVKLANVEIGQRLAVGRALDVSMALLAELEAETGDPALFAQLGEMMRNPNDAGQDKLNDIYMKVISHAGRVDSNKKISEALKNQITLQREMYGLTITQKLELTGKDGKDLMLGLSSAADLKAAVRGKP